MTTLKTTLNIGRAYPGWVFWVLWWAGSFVGALIYFIPVGVVNIVLGLDRLEDPARAAELGAGMRVLAAVLCGAACGSTIGLMQGLVLRLRLNHIGAWVAATVAGYASIGVLPLIANAFHPGWLDWAITLIVNGKMHWLARVEADWPASAWLPGFITLSLFGVVLGAIQWLVLRGRVPHAGWWIPITAVGWALAAALSTVPNRYLAVSFSFDLPAMVAGAGMAVLTARMKDEGGRMKKDTERMTGGSS